MHVSVRVCACENVNVMFAVVASCTYARVPVARLCAIESKASSVMKALGVIRMVEPGAAPLFSRNWSVKPNFLCLPFIRMKVGPWLPAALPQRREVIDTRESSVSFSCLRLDAQAITLVEPSHAITHSSSRLTLKWALHRSPNDKMIRSEKDLTPYSDTNMYKHKPAQPRSALQIHRKHLSQDASCQQCQ